MKVGLFYGSTTGNTARVATMIRDALGGIVDVFQNIKDTTRDDIACCDALILGVSTWEEGAPQEHWKDFLPELERLDLHGKTVALFGLGDQEGYSGRFQDGMAALYRIVRDNGATVVGQWPVAGYRCESSYAVEGDRFVGLAVDEDTQKELTAERVAKWAAQIRPFFEK